MLETEVIKSRIKLGLRESWEEIKYFMLKTLLSPCWKILGRLCSLIKKKEKEEHNCKDKD